MSIRENSKMFAFYHNFHRNTPMLIRGVATLFDYNFTPFKKFVNNLSHRKRRLILRNEDLVSAGYDPKNVGEYERCYECGNPKLLWLNCPICYRSVLYNRPKAFKNRRR
ncbi:hypothetical protein RF11_04519 [Thelohanellus kitauei]|uniref:Uncharacterized protein n=1 Tax=Thelohanellus kitauei TaxID=669202 RepID=A0A0C2MKD0_THEKT|nr:hypothetical protein RF11_04519 [Thelohanellus kitauei]